MSRGDVPLHRAAEPGIQIRFASCNRAQLQRRAGTTDRCHFPRAEIGVDGIDVAVRAAGDDGYPIAWHCAAANRTAAGLVLDIRSVSSDAGIQAVQGWRVDNTEHRRTVLDECDVDREF